MNQEETFTSEQFSAEANRHGGLVADMLNYAATTLRQQAARVDDMDAAADRLGDYLVREQSVYLAHKSLRAALEAALSAQPAPHPDDAAVDAFAEAMKAKLAEARAKGRGGWQDKDDCPQQRLSDMLRAHVEKGDPRDVANFCMFLHQRGESILPAEPVAQVEHVEAGDAYTRARLRIKKHFARPAAKPVTQGEAVGEVTKLVQRIKDFSCIHLKEGTGATDALYDLAVKHGASEAKAASFAHSANGEMNELQSCVYTIAQLALNLAAQPRAVEVAQGEAVGEVFGPKAVSTQVALNQPLPPGTKLYAARPRAVPDGWRRVLERALPFVRDEADKYEDDGSNEPLDVVEEIERLLAAPSAPQDAQKERK